MGKAARFRSTSTTTRKCISVLSEFFADFRTSNGLNWRPQPFPCRFIPRSEEIRQAIEREGREALQNLSMYDGESERVAEFFKRSKQEA